MARSAGYGAKDASGNFYFKALGDGQIKLGNSSDDLVEITGSIEQNGTSFQISGDDARIKINGDTNSHPGLEFYENGTRKWIIFNNYGDDSLDFKTNSNTRMVIDQNGKVGIGTQSPSTTLDVNGDINASGQFARGVASVNLGSGTTSTLNPATSGAGTLLVTASSITTPTSGGSEMMHICSLADGTIAGQVLTIIIVSNFLTGAGGASDMGVLLITPNTPLNSSTGIVTFTGSAAGGNPQGCTAVLMWTGSAWAILSTRRGGGSA